jgi:hypothetical protein
MKPRSMTILTWSSNMLSICTALFIFTACTTSPAPQPPEAEAISADTPLPSSEGGISAMFQKGVPGGVIVNTVEATVQLAAIDYTNRNMTLVGPDGNKVDIKAGADIVNFDQLQAGDLLKLTLTEEIVVYIDKDGESIPDESTRMVALAPKGGRPGGVIADTTQVTATIMAINSSGHAATLQFADGSSKTFPVRHDIDLERYKAGEKVVFLLTNMIAIKVEKP